MSDTCDHTWGVIRDPSFSMFCTKCGKVFDAKDKACSDSLTKLWLDSLEEGVLPVIRKMGL